MCVAAPLGAGVKGTRMPTSDDKPQAPRQAGAAKPSASGKTAAGVPAHQRPRPAYPANPAGKAGRHAASGQPAASRASHGPAGQGGKPAPGKRQPSTVTLTRGQFIAALAGAAVVAAVPTAFISSCATRLTEQPATETPEEQPWVSPYDWTCVVERENGLLAYVKNGVTLSESGIDVSEHDGEIDWAQVKAAGVDFAMLRLGYRGYGQGTMNLDKYFLANLSGAAAAGVKVGVYFFSQAISAEEAREEADYVVNSLAATDVELSYPIVFDEEPITDGNVARTDGMTSAQFSANALAFCQRVEETGYTPMLYGNQHELAKLDLSGELAAYDVWYAEYGVKKPTGEFDFVMWQYSDTGSIPGITASDGQVDLNIRFLEA